MTTTRLFPLCVFFGIASTAPVSGAATRVAFADSFATGRGNAFTATADNPSAVFYNIGGLTQLEGTQVRGGGYFFSADYEYSGLGGASAEVDSTFQLVPNFYASHNLEDSPASVGFGTYAPFTLGMDWSSDAPFAAVAYKSEIVYVKFHPVFAWKISDTLSVGFGPSFDYSDIEIRSTGPLGSFEGEDATVGASASILWRPSPKHSFGINYQAPTTMHYDGTSTAFGDTDAELKFPESIGAGYAYRPTPEWIFEFNLDWTNWDRSDDLTFSPALGPDIAIPLNWESAVNWELGATRYFDEGWHVSGGYTFVENAVPDEEFTPIVPDADRHYFQVGVGRDYGRLSWHFAYQIVFAPDRSVSGNANVLPNGDYDLDSQGATFSLAYRF
mgnify:CR=1 FL=1